MEAKLDAINARLAKLERLLSRPQPRVYRVKDIAALIGLSLRQTRQWAAEGRIPGKVPGSPRIALFHAKAVDAWIERGLK